MSAPNNDNGKLYLIPTTLGNAEPLEVLPLSIKRIVEQIDFYIVENEKTARRFIKRICPKKAQPNLKIQILNKYTKPEEIPTLVTPCLNGYNVGVISEAGCPGVADPGADVVTIAHEKNIRVVPLVGPSSILLALMASGMNGQSFAFTGYLPINKIEKKKAIKNLEKISQELNQSQIFMETPYRNDKLLADLISTLSPATLLCVASDITLSTEYIKTQSIAQWKTASTELLHKKPTIFIIHAK